MGTRTRKANGDSWIAEATDKDGYWNAFVTMGLKPDGTLDRRHLKRRKLNDLRKAVRELEAKRDAGVTGKGKPPTVAQLLERRLSVLRTRGRAPNTIRSYESVIRSAIIPRFGGQRIDRLLPEHLEDGYAAMLERDLSPAYVVKVHAILSSALEEQFRRGNIARNPCKLVEPPELEESERTGLSQDQARAVIQVALQRPAGVRWVLGLTTGMRQGEILGAEWQRLDEKRSELRTWYQLQRTLWRHGCADAALEAVSDEEKRRERRKELEHECAQEHCRVKACPKRCKRHRRACPPACPKNCTAHAAMCPQRKEGGLALRQLKEKRRKTIPVPPAVLVLLREHRSTQFEAKLLAADEWEEHGLMFCRWNGVAVDPKADWKEWAAILAEAGLPHLALHAGRHTAATIMLEKGVAIEVTQEILGHSDIRVTRGYRHVSSPLAQDAAARMGSLLPEAHFPETATGNATPEQDQEPPG